jgi:hypothetical protein
MFQRRTDDAEVSTSTFAVPVIFGFAIAAAVTDVAPDMTAASSPWSSILATVVSADDHVTPKFGAAAPWSTDAVSVNVAPV